MSRGCRTGGQVLLILAVALLAQLGALAVNVFSSGNGPWPGALDLIRRHPFAAGLVLTAAAAAAGVLELWTQRHAADAPPPAVPEPPDWVVRRPAEAGRVRRALRRKGEGGRGPLVVLHGPGGFGKTTLADLVCADRRTARRFRGGVHRVVLGRDLDGRAAVAARVNELVELITGSRPGYQDPDAAGRHLGRVLDERRRRVLVVVDDVWDEAHAAPFLVGGRRAARLLTSRVPAGSFPGATGVEVRDLPDADARTVLTWGLPALPAAAADGLLVVAGRWALLLRLVNRVLAEQIATGRDPAEAAADLLARLRSGGPGAVDSWAGPGPGGGAATDPEQRRRAVRTTIGAAGDLLGEPGGLDRLAELTVFTEDEAVPLPLIARLWAATAGLDETRARGLAGRLARLSLVSPAPEPGGAVAMHDTVRAYLRAGLGGGRVRELHATLLDARGAELPREPVRGGGTATAWWRMEAADRYLWDNLAVHLAAAGRDEEAARLVTDLRWVIARLRWSGPVAVLADLDAHGTGARAGVLRAELARWAHLLSPTDPLEAVQDVFLARLRYVPGWEDEARDVAAALDPPRLVPRAPLPDRPDPALRQTLTGHDGAVTAVVVAPDGTWLASAGADGTVRVWDAATGAERRRLRELGGAAVALAVTRDGALLAAASHRRVQLWDAATGEPHGTVTSPLDGFGALAFGAGRDLAIRAGDRLSRCDAEARRVLRRSPRRAGETAGLAFSLDGTVLAEAWNPPLRRSRRYGTLQREGVVRVWDPAGWRPVTELRGHEDVVTAVAAAPGGTWLASAGADMAVRLWDLRTGEPGHVLTGHPGPVAAVAVAPDGTWLATGGDETVRLWDAGTGAVRAVLTGHRRVVTGVAIAPDGAWLASASRDGTVRIWDAAADRSRVREVGTAPARMSWRAAASRLRVAAAADPRGAWLAVVDDREIMIVDVAGRSVARRLGGHRWGADALAAAPDGRWLASATGTDRTLVLWDTGTWERVASIGLDGGPEAMAVGPGGDWIAVVLGTDVQIVETASGRVTARIAQPDARAVAAAPDGAWLATAGEEGTIRVWDPATGTELRRSGGHARRISALAAAPDGSWLASVGDDPIVMMWDPATGELLRTLSGAPGALHALAVAPDGSWLAAAGDDGVVRVWETATGALCAALVIPGRDALSYRRIAALAVPADGGWIAAAAVRQGRVWDTAPVAALVARAAARPDGGAGGAGDGHAPAAVAFAPGGSWLATGGGDGTLRILDPASGETTVLAGHTGGIEAVAVAPDGARIATAGADRTVRLWDPRGAELTRTFAAGPVVFSPAVRRRTRAWEALRRTGRRLLVPQWSMHAVAISPDGTWVAWTGGDHALRIWDTVHDAVHAHPTGSLRSLTALAVAPDGSWLAYAGRDRAVRVWDAASGAVRLTLRGHGGTVRSLAVSPDGALLVSAGDDREIRVWDAASGRPVRVLDHHRAPVRAVAVSRDGLLASADTAGRLRVAELGTGRRVAMMRVDGGLAGCAWSGDGGVLAAVGVRGLLLLDVLT
ncbi:NB-ARC domain-containing protein [Actinomadura geliboluensis]|uniref:NB-ARC domain-containing protein n=1 Tax=Actinomadura geliboluensis TaxID=882440 RepID=UPI0036B2E1BE